MSRSPSRPDHELGSPDPKSARTAEFMPLHLFMIALGNLVISLLAERSGRQLDLAREMAAYLSPRPRCTCFTWRAGPCMSVP